MASTNEPAELWRRIIIGGERKSWVLFEHGTCVVLTDPAGDLADEAVAILREYGPVHIGTPSADMNAIELTSAPGWVVACHHPGILNYVAPDDLSVTEPDDLRVALTGRSNRDDDAHDLTVVHVEDNRAHAGRADTGSVDGVVGFASAKKFSSWVSADRSGRSAGERALQDALDHHPEQVAKAAFDLAMLRKERGDVAGAASACQLAIDSGEADYGSRAAVLLALLREEQGDVARAAAAYQLAIDSGHPNNAPGAAYNLGRAALRAGRQRGRGDRVSAGDRLR